MNGFWMGHQMLGDVLGFCAAAHLYACKIGRPVPVWFDPSRKDACQYFEGVVWTPREQLPRAVDCGGTPTPDEWPALNGVTRFYRFMDPAMRSPKSFDVHFNRPRRPSSEQLIGLITHSNLQGDIDEEPLAEMLSEARRRYPEHRIGCFGCFDNVRLPPEVEDWRRPQCDISWIIPFMEGLSLLIAAQSGPCYVAAGWRLPMWVYHSREPHWDWKLNYETYHVQRWWSRKIPDPFSVVFDRIYQTGGWNGLGSGPGSVPAINREYLCLLNQLIRRTPSIKTILDIGCGDWQLMQHVDLQGKDYQGIDVSPWIIQANQRKFNRPGVRFEVLNPLLEDIPNADLIIVKDVLSHLPNADAATMLRKIREKSRFALLTDDYADQNQGDIALGEHRRINILAEPFGYPGVVICSYNGKQVVLGTGGSASTAVADAA